MPVSDLSLTILGSGGALPVAGRFPSSQYLQFRNQGFLIDAGEGAQVQMMRLGVSHGRIGHIFISHLHGDHYLGLMGLLFSMHLSRRTADLHLYSHTGLEEIIMLQLKMARSVLSYRIHFHHLTPGAIETILETDLLTVTAFPLRHRIPCSGFLFREKPQPRKMNKEKMPEGMLLQHIALLKQGLDVIDETGNVIYPVDAYTLPPAPLRSYAYCSDTDFFPEIVKTIAGATLVYHEATFTEADVTRARETFHSTAREAATIAKMAGATSLLIGHLSARYRETDTLLNEAREVFPATEIAADGQTHQIDLQAFSPIAE